MSASHGHGHRSRHRLARGNEGRVGLAAVLTGLFMIVEVIGGIYAGSLALLADAGHMLADFASLALAWVAFRVARRPADARRTFGFARMEVLAAFVNGLALFAICLWIVVEAGRRFVAPVDVLAVPMLVVAAIGLGVNVAALLILHGGDRDNLNMRAAAAHVAGDLMGSVAALAAALIIIVSGWTYADPLLSVFVAGLIFRSAWRIVAESGHILLEGTPEGLDTERIAAGLKADIGGVVDIHHVHAWSLSQQRPMVTLHAQIDEPAQGEAIVQDIKAWLRRRYNVDHTTVEIERRACADDDERI